ncbi:MAG: hypothetical protein WCG74_00040 [Sediminibacterium sp.]
MKKIIGALALLLPATTWAHPGHGETDGYSIIHYFSEPQHAIITLGVMTIAVIYILRERKRNRA